jgi:putative SOS response-associated peptidase YedK
MCGRYSNTVGPEEITEKLGLLLGVKVTETAGTGRYKIFPAEKVLTIVRPESEHDPVARLLRWGLIPSFAKDMKIGTLINA